MSLHNKNARCTSALILALLAVCRTYGSELTYGDSLTNQQPVIKVNLRNEEVVCNQPVRRAYANYGTNQFAFVVPDTFRMDASNPEKITMTCSNPDCFLVIQVMDANQPPQGKLSTDYYRELLKKEHPGTKVVEEFSRSVANHSGPAFDIEWTNSSGSAQSARVAFIPSAAGTLEFSLICGSEHFSDSLYFYNSFLLSFRTNEGGKLEIAHLSDKF